MADETKAEENKTQIESLKQEKQQMDELIQKTGATTLEPYQQQKVATTTSPNATDSTTVTTTKSVQQQQVSSSDNKEPEQQQSTTTQQQATSQTIQSSQAQQPDVDQTNLIINYLPPTMSEGTLATLFSPYGLLERCKIVVDLQTLRSRGYGFVKYDNPISAERALNALNGYELNGKKLKVAFARQQCKAITNSNLYLTNIPPHFTDANLVQLFKDYGKIIECRVLLDQNGQSRGVGFVRMDTHHNAIQALQAMDQYIIDDKHPPLLVKLAQRRVPRRFWQEQNGNNGGRNNGQQRGGNNKGYMGQNNNNLAKGGMGNKNRNKRNNLNNSSNRKQYGGNNATRSSQQQSGGHMPSMNNMGGPQQRKQGGYYRPRNQYKGGQSKQYGAQQSGQSAQQQQQRRGNGPPYFTQAPMYGDAPYGMPAYGQPSHAPYGAPQTHIPQQMAASSVMSANNPPPNVSNQDDQKQSLQPKSFNVLVFNLPKHFNVDHVINMYAKYGPVQSVNIRDANSDHRFPKKGRFAIISYFYFNDAQRAQNETNRLEISGNNELDQAPIVLETIFEPPSSSK